MIIFRIKELRKARNISAYNLSKSVGISRSYLSLLENNKFFNPTLEVLSKISEALNVNVKDLFYTSFDINFLRVKMYEIINISGINSEEALKISQLITLLLNIEDD